MTLPTATPRAEFRRKDGSPRKGSTGGLPNPKLVARAREMYRQELVRPVEIARRLAAEFGVSEGTGYRYANRVRAECQPHTAAERDDETAQTLARLDDLYERALEADDRKEARHLTVERAKMRGLYAPTQLEHSGSVTTGVLVVPAPVLDPEGES